MIPRPRTGAALQASARLPETRRAAGDPRPGIGLGAVLAATGLGLVGAAVLGRLARPRPRQKVRAARRVRDGAAVLAASVLADSAMEHFEGRYYNPAMYAAPAMAAAVLAAALAEPTSRTSPSRGAPVAGAVAGGLVSATLATGAAVGLGGLGFHVYNILKRPGGLSWNNLFYAAPIGAPGALMVAGLLGLGAARLETPARSRAVARRQGRVLGGAIGLSLLATAAEVTLLHFRGAFQNPAMFLPVTVPPATGVVLIADAAWPSAGLDRLARQLLQATAVLGVAGTGFHAYGVSRNMGGWGNWRQNLLAGPPMPAPISFTGLAIAGLAGLALMHAEGDER